MSLGSFRKYSIAAGVLGKAGLISDLDLCVVLVVPRDAWDLGFAGGLKSWVPRGAISK
jgi:hypothetical protein